MRTFNDFEKIVHSVSLPEDFKVNNQVLHNVPFEHYDLFINIMKRGARISNAVSIMNRIVKISIDTSLTTEEALSVGDQFRLINSLFN